MIILEVLNMEKMMVNLILFGLAFNYLLTTYLKASMILMFLGCAFLFIDNLKLFKFKHLIMLVIINYILFNFIKFMGLELLIKHQYFILMIGFNMLNIYLYFKKNNFDFLSSHIKIFNILTFVALIFIFIALIYPEFAINKDVYRHGKISMISFIILIFLPSISIFYSVYSYKFLYKMLKYRNV